MRSVLCLLVCVLLAACAGEPSSYIAGSCGLGPAIDLPVEMHGPAPIVTVTINQRQANLVLDTGASTSVLRRDVIAVLGVGLVPSAGSQIHDVQGERGAQLGRVGELKFGSVTLSNLPVIVSDGGIADGVLGLDVLQHFDVDVNLPKSEVVLHQGGLCPNDKPPLDGTVLQMPALRGVAHGVGRYRQVSPFLLAPVILDGAKALAMLDTGSLAGSMVSAALAEKAGVSVAMLEADPVAKVRGFGPAASLRLHRFGQLNVGPEIFQAPTLLVGGDPAATFPVVLGSDYFQHHRVWFNFVSDRIFSVPVAP